MAADEIGLRAEEVAEGLGTVRQAREDLPPTASILQARGPGIGATQAFYGEVMYAIRAAAAATDAIAKQVSQTEVGAKEAIAALEAADQITAEAASRLEEIIDGPEPGIAPITSYTPAPSPNTNASQTW